MHVQLKVGIVAIVLAVATAATAQEAAAPTLAPDAVLRLQNFELRAENIALKQAQLAASFAALQSEANEFAKSLQRDGYTLTRGDDGAWRYVSVPKVQQ